MEMAYREQWVAEIEALRGILGGFRLSEETKWGKPCYTIEGKNIVLLQRFNDYIALMFFKGALLKDPKKILSRIGEHMQVPRQLRFTTVAEVLKLEPTIKAYLREAIELEKSGAKVKLKAVADYDVPEELQTELNADPGLKKAFAALTPGRQKGYIFHIASAKQSATRASRVQKCVPHILAGKGMND